MIGNVTWGGVTRVVGVEHLEDFIEKRGVDVLRLQMAMSNLNCLEPERLTP